MSYDAFGRVLTETNYTGTLIIKVFSYDDQNNTLCLTSPQENIQIVTQFNAFGDKLSLKDANGNTTDFHYDERGQLIRVDSPEQAFKEYHYDAAGMLSWQQDEGGQRTEYRYDATGHVLAQLIDPQGLALATTYQYDGLGRQLRVTDANGCVKQFVYDDQSRLLQSCIDPDGLNLVTLYTYDDRGLVLRQTQINRQGTNKSTAYQWDALGRRIATIEDPDGLAHTTTYQYDANDNLVSQTDANRHTTHYVYDVMNRCRYQINARGVVTEHEYDLNGFEVHTVTYARPVAAFSGYDEASLKSVLQEDPSHDQHQFHVFNSMGQVLAAFDASGYATTYGYDGNGNVVSTSRIRHCNVLRGIKKR